MILLVVLGLIVGLAVLFMVGVALLSWLVLVGTFIAVTLILALVLPDPSLAFVLAFPVTGGLFWACGKWGASQGESS